jgi:hypothetical protein
MNVKPSSTRRAQRGRLASLLTATFLVAACVGEAPQTSGSGDATTTAIPTGGSSTGVGAASPSTMPRSASPPPPGPVCEDKTRPTRGPEPTLPPVPQPVINPGNPESAAALTDAVAQVTALRSYRFSVDVVGRDVQLFQPSLIDFGLRGVLTHSDGIAIDAIIGTRMNEPNHTAAISSSDRLVMGNGYIWGSGTQSGALQPAAVGLLDNLVLALTPEGLATRLVAPFAAGFERVGQETRGGVVTEHYRASRGGLAAYASLLQFDGDLKVDAWIAVGDGYLAGVHVAGTAGHQVQSDGTTADDALLIAFDVTAPNAAANVVELPVAPLPDPQRPVGPAVDLDLEYQVLPVNGTLPTAHELDTISVTMRDRLDVYTRPVTVTIVGSDRIVITVCTTRADEDRLLILANGGVTAVMLPPNVYGSTTIQGTKPLPAVGSPVDPALPLTVPVARAGLARSHVDPLTGRRGVSFVLGNKERETFAKAVEGHRGEYVAVVMDGIVMATVAVDDEVAKAHFAFTGDYTEAEAHRLASFLNKDPVGFPLRVVRDVERPASGS